MSSGRRSQKVTLFELDNDGDLVQKEEEQSPTKRSIEEESPLKSPTKKQKVKKEVVEGEEDIKPKSSPIKKTKFILKLEKAHPAPSNWRQVYDIIDKQRSTIVAPVDVMGCEQGGRQPGEAPVSIKETRLSTLVSLMLSSQTKDPVTHQATVNLRALPGGLTIDMLLNTDPEIINQAICKVGFHNVKTKHLKALAVSLNEREDKDVPNDLDELLSLAGVGPKMAILTLQSFGFNVGIGVDVHVHRITQRLGWHKKEPKNPEETRLNLESWLPKELYRPINKLLVGFGQEICRPIGPRCDLCEVAKIPKLCPSKQAVSPRKASPKKKKEESDPILEIEIDLKVATDVFVKEEDVAEEDVKPLVW